MSSIKYLFIFKPVDHHCRFIAKMITNIFQAHMHIYIYVPRWCVYLQRNIYVESSCQTNLSVHKSVIMDFCEWIHPWIHAFQAFFICIFCFFCFMNFCVYRIFRTRMNVRTVKNLFWHFQFSCFISISGKECTKVHSINCYLLFLPYLKKIPSNTSKKWFDDEWTHTLATI